MSISRLIGAVSIIFSAALASNIVPCFVPFAVLAQEKSEEISEADSQNKETQRADRLKADQEYYELLELFADTLDQIERNYIQSISRRELMEAAIQGVLAKLDPYSNYIAPDELEQFKGSVEHEFGGIGIQITGPPNTEWLTIISPLVGSPAYRAGLMAGDQIIKIEGVSTKGLRVDGAVRKLKGKVGTTVSFTVRHPRGGSIEEVSIRREIIKVDSVMGERRQEDDSWDFLFDHQKQIGYIRVTAFSRNTAPDLRNALEELKSQKMRGLVLDLRFNPGGLLSSAIEVCDMFISSGRIVSTSGRNTPERAWDARAEETYEGFPMAVLVNHYSASASEIVSACLQDHHRAIVVGTRTWGKGSVQNIIELEHGKSALKLTTAGYLRPSGKNIHRLNDAKDEDDWGVIPNEGYKIKLSDSQMVRLINHQHDQGIVAAKTDEEPEKQSEEDPPFVDRQLQKALKYLAEELGDTPAETEQADEKSPRSDPSEEDSSLAEKPEKQKEKSPEK